MTVQELIEKLKNFDPTHDVQVYDAAQSELFIVTDIAWNSSNENAVLYIENA